MTGMTAVLGSDGATTTDPGSSSDMSAHPVRPQGAPLSVHESGDRLGTTHEHTHSPIMTNPEFQKLLNHTSTEKKARLLDALADDLGVEVKAPDNTGLDALGKALSTGPGITPSQSKADQESTDSVDDLAAVLGGGN